MSLGTSIFPKKGKTNFPHFSKKFREASKFHLLAFLFCASETSSEITTFLAQKRKGCLKIWEASWETETDNSASISLPLADLVQISNFQFF